MNGLSSRSDGGADSREDKPDDGTGDCLFFVFLGAGWGSSMTISTSPGYWKVLVLRLVRVETLIVSPAFLLDSCSRTFNFSRGFLAGGGSTGGDSVAGVGGVGLGLARCSASLRSWAMADLKSEAGPMPRSVASLYFRIFALEMREVK